MLSRPEPGYTDTYYSRTLTDRDQNYPALQGECFADVCIIGGGLAGINCAFGLSQRGKSVALIEASRIGGGASGRNGGFVERGYAADHEEIEKRVSHEQASALIRLTRDANQLILDRIAAFHIDGGPLNPGMLTVTWRDQPDSVRKYVDNANHNFDAGLEYWPVDRVREHCKTSRYFQGFYTPHAFQLHSLRYLHGLARAMAGQGGKIFENTKALRIEKDGAGWRVHAEGGTVRAEHVVLCCAMDSHGLNRKIENAAFPVQTYVMTTNPLSDEDLKGSINSPHAIYDVRCSSDYYRVLPDNRVMWGGRLALWAEPSDIAALLLKDMLKIYPQLKGKVKAEVAWSGTMCYAPHKMPQIGELEPGYWYCTAFGGHGLAATTAGGEAIAEAITGNRGMVDLFAPFGLTYAGSGAGRYVAQMIYWWWRLCDYASLKSTMSGA